MAYTLFPNSTAQIRSLKTDKQKISEIVSVYNYLTAKFKAVKTPINIDPTITSTINVSRDLQAYTKIADIVSANKIKFIKLKFGNGSSGGRGIKNKGNLFENQFAQALSDYHSGEKINDVSLIPTIEGLYKTYNLSKYKNLHVHQAGAKNTKRPLIFGPNIIMKAEGQKGFDLGPIVTDITLYSNPDKNKPVAFLSLKFAGTTTFFNVGLRTVLTPEEIKKNKITNENGNRILKLFHIDKDIFCEVFNGKLTKGYSENVWSKMPSVQKTMLETLLQSGIGYGYHVIHKLGGAIKSTQINESYMKTAAKPESCMVYYGGKTGTGKRIDMVIKTGKYELKLNIRDTQGADGYPTRLMGDFTYL